MPKRIMVVEDDEELNEILYYNLTQAGYVVTQARDGVDAMERAEAERPDLVLLDLMMPRADGWEVCRRFAADPDLRQTPIVVFTAKGAREDFDQARAFNVAGYFVKPYATADVLKHVEKVLFSGGARSG